MEKLNKIYGGFQKQEISKQQKIAEQTKTKVEDVINASLMSLFGMKNDTNKKNRQNEISELSSENEITYLEEELSRILGVHDKMMTLKEKDKKLLSLG